MLKLAILSENHFKQSDFRCSQTSQLVQAFLIKFNDIPSERKR